MLYPSVDELLEKVGNRYELVMIIAKRAREITDKHEYEKEGKVLKPITEAINELDRDKISFRRPDFVKPQNQAEK